MKKQIVLTSLWLAAVSCVLQAQTGPFDPANWPETADAAKIVHFVTTDGTLAPLGDSWIQGGMKILSGGDQQTESVNIGGYTGLRVTGSYLNVSDGDYIEWADDAGIDILMQVYGDAGVLAGNGTARNFNFLVGALPELAAPLGGRIAVEAKNQKWNWVLFRIDNPVRGSDGGRLVGTVAAGAEGDFRFGGVNGGTIRLEGVPNLIVRAIAWGETGAFGEPDAINIYAPPDGCDPEPETNLASIDINAGTADHLVAMNGGDQEIELVDAAGPDTDKRKALRPKGNYVNFAITENYLGQPCNEPRAVKVCLDFYDDPALTGARFGPEAYTTDALGAIGIYPAGQRQTLAGTGRWIRRSWVLPAVSLFGVNVAPNTGGPRLAFENGAVAISRYAIAVLRTGDHPLAGQDPLEDCIADPLVCTDAYGSYVEMDLANGVLNGLAPGSSGGDQVMIQEEAGPEDDRRMSIRAARNDGPAGFGHTYVNLAITGQALGPSSQPNARLAICVTYFDAADLRGESFRPEVYQTERNGSLTLGFTPGNIAKVLEGTDRWREAYFEIGDVKFLGVNQGPQAAARFFSSGKIPFSRVQYAVIRPCGPNAGFNALEACKGVRLQVARQESGSLRFTWPRSQPGYVLEESASLGADAAWTPVADLPVEDDLNYVLDLSPTANRYFRLRK